MGSLPYGAGPGAPTSTSRSITAIPAAREQRRVYSERMPSDRSPGLIAQTRGEVGHRVGDESPVVNNRFASLGSPTPGVYSRRRPISASQQRKPFIPPRAIPEQRLQWPAPAREGQLRARGRPSTLACARCAWRRDHRLSRSRDELAFAVKAGEPRRSLAIDLILSSRASPPLRQAAHHCRHGRYARDCPSERQAERERARVAPSATATPGTPSVSSSRCQCLPIASARSATPSIASSSEAPASASRLAVVPIRDSASRSTE